ncbi:hypothetical protein M885DRAFT_159296 [Pelagophyceae sp. CCMP2097]|nr:hypothetical protein M885DRAFT_159296 [Pelagophyceae sp. CCMP2097]
MPTEVYRRLRASPEAPPASPLTDAAPRLDSAAALDPRLNLVAMQAAMQAELLAIQPVVGGTSGAPPAPSTASTFSLGPTSPISPKKRQSIWARALEATVNHAAVATAALETATENATRAIETASENAARAIEQAAENATRAIETAADRAAMRKEDAKADAKANNVRLVPGDFSSLIRRLFHRRTRRGRPSTSAANCSRRRR